MKSVPGYYLQHIIIGVTEQSHGQSPAIGAQ